MLFCRRRWLFVAGLHSAVHAGPEAALSRHVGPVDYQRLCNHCVRCVCERVGTCDNRHDRH